MQRRLVLSSIVTTVVAIVLFAAPLAFATRLVLLRDAEDALERAALRVAGAIDPADVAGAARRDPAAPRVRPPDGVTLTVYGPDGRLLAGGGPAASRAVRAAAAEVVVQRVDREGTIEVAVPVEAKGVVVAVVRAAEPASAVRSRTARAVAALAGLALAVVGLSVLVARRQARRVSGPIHALTAATRALADGDFGVRVRPSGVQELDEAGDALVGTAARLGALLEREAGFADDVAHQLRTPLTGLRLAIESALTGPDDALRARLSTVADATDRLAVVVDDLAALRRPPAAGTSSPVSAGTLARMVEDRWRTAYERAVRGLDVVVEAEDATTVATPAAVRQAMDVLLENGLRHGRGDVTVTFRAAHGALAVDVQDEGADIRLPAADLFRRGVTTASGQGIGLSLARSVVQAEGGRLELTSRAPTTFTLLLPGPWSPKSLGTP